METCVTCQAQFAISFVGPTTAKPPRGAQEATAALLLVRLLLGTLGTHGPASPAGGGLLRQCLRD